MDFFEFFISFLLEILNEVLFFSGRVIGKKTILLSSLILGVILLLLIVALFVK